MFVPCDIRIRSAMAIAGSLLLFVFTACKPPEPAAQVDPSELARLTQENREVARLRRENDELKRLRTDNEELHKLRAAVGELSQLRDENQTLRNQLAQRPASMRSPQAPELAAVEPSVLQPIENLPQAFAEAELALESSDLREEDLPKEGDGILIDQTVIGLLIPEFATNNGGPYEISGWLKAKGVALKNYQQFNVLGITNYQILRAEPKK